MTRCSLPDSCNRTERRHHSLWILSEVNWDIIKYTLRTHFVHRDMIKLKIQKDPVTSKKNFVLYECSASFHCRRRSLQVTSSDKWPFQSSSRLFAPLVPSLSVICAIKCSICVSLFVSNTIVKIWIFPQHASWRLWRLMEGHPLSLVKTLFWGDWVVLYGRSSEASRGPLFGR